MLTAGLAAGMVTASAGSTSFSLSPGKQAYHQGDTAFTDGTAGTTYKRPRKAGGPLYVATVVRAVGNHTGYRGKLRIRNNGSMRLIMGRVKSGTETDVAQKSLRARVPVGRRVRVQTSVSGSSPVTVKMRAWVVGKTRPRWQLRYSDSTSARITSEGKSLAWTYLSSSAKRSVKVPYARMTVRPRTSTSTSTKTPSPTPAPSGPTDLPGWKLAMVEDFNSIDSSRWNVRNNTYNSNEDSYLLAANTTIDNGALRIQGKKQSVGGRNYTSGYVDTNGKYSLPNYFRVEVRAKVPMEQGMWAAPLWLRPADYSGGEIDLVETYGSEAESTPYVHHTIHTEYGSTHKQHVFRKKTSELPGSATDWHTYVMEKSPGKLTMWVDGIRTATYTSTTPSWYDKYYEVGKRWHLRVNLQIGGKWGGLPDSTTDWTPDRTAMKVDYIRTWVPQ